MCSQIFCLSLTRAASTAEARQEIRNASLECLWGFRVVSLIWIDISRVSGPLNSHKPATASKGPYAGGGVPNASTLQCLKQFNHFLIEMDQW